MRIALRRARSSVGGAPMRDGVEVIVDDDGPGIPDHAIERIFERFYTDRPQQGFGQNSGLGLSISRQIVEAHGGWIRAQNRTKPDGSTLGARFTVGCRRPRNERPAPGDDPRLRSRHRRDRGADPGQIGNRQVFARHGSFEAAGSKGVFARLVADDRVALHAAGDRLIAAPHPALAGMVEQRGPALSR